MNTNLSSVKALDSITLGTKTSLSFSESEFLISDKHANSSFTHNNISFFVLSKKKKKDS